MLFVPEQDPTYRYIAIDPGSNTLGLSVFDVNLVTMEESVLEAVTFNGEKLSARSPYVNEVHGDKFARLKAHEENLVRLMFKWKPNAVICESPFLGRFPQAFAALTETLSMIRRAVYAYDPTICLETVDPPTAKLAVGVSGKGKDKEDVRQGVLKLREQGVKFNMVARLEDLDEHSIDSIAVGHHKYLRIKQAFAR